MNPDNKEISDCTTRSLLFCLGLEKKDYPDMLERQRNVSLAAGDKKSDWNSIYVSESILTANNWAKIIFLKKLKRYAVCDLFQKLDCKIFTESYQHVAPIYRGKIYDTWDCSRGFVDVIMFPAKYLKQIDKILHNAEVQFINN